MFTLFPSKLQSFEGNYCILLLCWESLYFMASLSFYFRWLLLHFTRPLSTPRIFTPCVSFLLCTPYVFIWKYSLWFSFPLNRQLFTLKLAFLTVKIGVKVTCLSLVILMNISYNKKTGCILVSSQLKNNLVLRMKLTKQKWRVKLCEKIRQ